DLLLPGYGNAGRRRGRPRRPAPRAELSRRSLVVAYRTRSHQYVVPTSGMCLPPVSAPPAPDPRGGRTRRFASDHAKTRMDLADRGTGTDERRQSVGRVSELRNAFANEPPRHHLALPLDLHRSPRFADESVAQQTVGRLADLNPAGIASRFHARCGVHRVAPHVKDELPSANHAADHRARAEPDAEVEAAATSVAAV